MQVKFVIAESNWKTKLLKQKQAKTAQQSFNNQTAKEEQDSDQSQFQMDPETRFFDPKNKQKKSKSDQISVDSMIALYILKPSSQPTNSDIVDRTNFIPAKEISYQMVFKPQSFGNSHSFCIMPATYKVNFIRKISKRSLFYQFHPTII